MTTGRVGEPSFDVIIIGAGAAGCVLAGRLSEVSDRRVLLIEAGPDAPAEREHADIRDPTALAHSNPRFSWPNLSAEVGVDPGNGQPRSSRQYLQGYGVGGGSNINGMIAFRGQPADYNQWRASGAEGWGWDDVLPYFKKLERDLDFCGPLHGNSGPIPIRRIRPSASAPFSAAITRALQRRGYPLIEDCNADFRDGISAVPLSNLPDRRVSASMAFLNTSVRQRKNLTILADTSAERLAIRDGRVCGVVARSSIGVQQFLARETIVSCGALYSPTLLMRSGIGPGGKLHALGIDVVRDLPGVGGNLQNHPQLLLATHLVGASADSHGERAMGLMWLRYSSGMERCAEHDMGIVIADKSSWHPLGRRIGAIAACLHEPYSRGSVEVTSADPSVAPLVRFNLLSDSRDFARMVAGLRFALELFTDGNVVQVRNEVFLPKSKIVGELNRRSRWNWLRAAVIASLLDIPSIRESVLRDSTLDVHKVARDEDALRLLVRERTGLAHHVCGTCKIGRADDLRAVVDAACRVRGVDGLRVVDPSVFPTIPQAGLHIPVLMAAEKMADQVKTEWRKLAAAGPVASGVTATASVRASLSSCT